MLRRIFVGLAIFAVLVLLLVFVAGRGWFGALEAGGIAHEQARPSAELAEATRQQEAAATAIGASAPKQILFGDLHAHTTFSTDAFTLSLPMVGGEGAHPPADACDFARHCAALDFWSINDHAEELTPRQWQETVASIRQCNAVAGDSPDTVAFLGWEWTQAGTTPDNHYGHKNVVLRHTDDARIPARPIGAEPVLGTLRVGYLGNWARGGAALLMGGRFHDWARFLTERDDTTRCSANLPVRDLPKECIELAATPEVLFEKLDDWGHDSIVIPHGTTWGAYTPPGSSWDKQMRGDMFDPERQRLFEVYSGHGTSEVHRPWRAVEVGEGGAPSCPEPSEGHLPSCWRAGEIIEQRCADAGESPEECGRRAAIARAHYVEGGIPGHLTVPGVEAEEWLDAGQCSDCMQPAFNYRPGGSAQYVLALGGFEEDGATPRRFRPGFIASSDNHAARPGTGYKENRRRGSTESVGASRDPEDLGPMAALIAPPDRERTPRSLPPDEAVRGAAGFQLLEAERSVTFLLTGGLIATHADGRTRDDIWRALERREVYGTTGPRMLLWFDLINPRASGGETAPMGSEVTLASDPIFQVRAVGSFEQKAGCPERAARALGAEQLERICQGECYHPSDTRRLVTRIEVVRIRPQVSPDEDVAELIEDPWLRYACDPDPAGCVITFSDPDFLETGREAVYYVRAFEAPKPGINAGNLRCERDADGRCTAVQLCPGPKGADDACLSDHEPRAWSSPIYLDPAEGFGSGFATSAASMK